MWNTGIWAPEISTLEVVSLSSRVSHAPHFSRTSRAMWEGPNKIKMPILTPDPYLSQHVTCNKMKAFSHYVAPLGHSHISRIVRENF